jgi:hypothetical protein
MSRGAVPTRWSERKNNRPMSEVLGTWQRGEIALRQALGRRHLLGTFSLRTDLPSISSSTRARACARVQYAACR